MKSNDDLFEERIKRNRQRKKLEEERMLVIDKQRKIIKDKVKLIATAILVAPLLYLLPLGFVSFFDWITPDMSVEDSSKYTCITEAEQAGRAGGNPNFSHATYVADETALLHFKAGDGREWTTTYFCR